MGKKQPINPINNNTPEIKYKSISITTYVCLKIDYYLNYYILTRMDIKKELLKEHSKAQAEYIANFIGNDAAKFEELMRLFMSSHYRTNQRSAWVLSKCADKYPELIAPHIEPLIKNLKEDIHVAVKRNTLRVLQEIEIPKDLWGLTVDICFNTLASNQEPIAVKVFAMSVLHNIAQKEPDLKNELKMIIEDQLPYGSAGFKSRAKKILKQL